MCNHLGHFDYKFIYNKIIYGRLVQNGILNALMEHIWKGPMLKTLKTLKRKEGYHSSRASRHLAAARAQALCADPAL